MTESYKLRCTLVGHTMDVRGVTTGITEGGKDFIVSGSRDRSSKIWVPAEDGTFEMFQSCEGHTNFVSCVCLIPPSTKHPSGLILTGGHDHTILAFEMGKHSPLFRLISHKGTVCSIAATSDSLLVSGSWDQTAKIWSEQENIATLTGHQAAVWAVATIPGAEHKVLTGSADKEIRLWVNNQTKNIYRGHTDCVRALAVMDQNRFLSGSNDATIRLWNIEQGETINTFYGHSNYIYSLSLLPNSQDFVSAGEDRTLRIWKGGDCSQIIYLPAMSVWTVSALKNGDVVTGSSDGVVRIFTNEPERMASIDALLDFEEQVGRFSVGAQQDLGGMKISDLPGPEALVNPGKKNGETKMIREGGLVGCYSWSEPDKKWTKVGDVVGASGATQNTSGRVLHEGKEYDYVFSVELDDKTTCKLPFNITEDPWFAAQKFIEKNNLSQTHLDQVANFIISNTKGVQLGTATSTEYADPFTGGNRYVPGSSTSGLQQGGGGGVDPFTGSGAYRTGSTPVAMDTSAPPAAPCFPVTDYLRFPQLPNFEALKGKLTEFVQALGPQAGVGETGVQDLLRVGTTAEWDEQLDTVLRSCLQWPLDKIFPVLDLLRVGVLKPGVAQALHKSDTFDSILNLSLVQENATNQMLALRILCNLFGSENGFLMKKESEIISKVLSHISKGKNNQVASATLLLNYSILVSGRESLATFNPAWSNIETQTEILMGIISLIEALDEPEATYRLLVGIGNIIAGNKTTTELLQSLGGDSLVGNYSQNGTLPKVKECAQQLVTRLRQN